VYNSESTLNELCERIRKIFLDITDNYEIILIDDGSHDNSWRIMKELHFKDNRVKIIKLIKNFGQHNALMCGFNHVSGSKIITMDDDLQHPPEEIPKLISALYENEGVDGIIGKPYEKKHGTIRNIGSWFVGEMDRQIFGKPKNLKMGSFRLLKREVIDAMVQNKSHNPTIGPILLSTTLNLRNVMVEHEERRVGKSGYNITKMIKTTLDNILNYSTIPLKLISIIGIFTSSMSFLLAVYLIWKKLVFNMAPQGWTSIMVINLFFFGVLLFSIGIIGEYLIRIIRQVNDYHQYITKEINF
jgi:glycosyltransferase involved in cell wall biosynthesis